MAVEWATWNGSPDDYNRRLGAFFKNASSFTLPDGIQEVVAASVISVTGQQPQYRVQVLLHLRRLVPVTPAEAQAAAPVNVPVTQEDLLRWKQGGTLDQQKTVPVWRDYLLKVEVPVQAKENQAQATGLPVIIANNQGEGVIKEPECNESASQQFITFINQFLGLYYAGGSLANFLAPGAAITAAGGWKLESVDEVLVDNSVNPTRACVRATISAPGAGRLVQRMFLKIKMERGSYLVEDLGAQPQ
ncbi:conjugal transfer protein [Neomoorella thermoacetica]|uniref:conjugal transfer protein n=1 Tax=Neomoorella thermoacetica TaxID=1525 RepID=UPI0009BED8EE|nr:conjugal transfer protein [Moorella thermoacetica]